MNALVSLKQAPDVTLQGLTKRYTNHGPAVLDGLDLELSACQFNVILGPSGCGKSTLLRLVAGLEQPDSGRVLIGGQDVTRLPPAQRQCAMVFQHYALYPHMTVRDNIGYGLRVAGVPKAERNARVEEIARTLTLDALLERKPAQLSGGQRQRVAIGRALVRRPPVLLFDEPLCNLDSALRQDMRLELRRLHQQTGCTILYVTHDQTEAMALADRIIVLDRGRTEQIDTPQVLYRQPASTRVARCLGTPPMNLLAVRREGVGALILNDGQRLALQLPAELPVSPTLLLGIRPESVRFGAHALQASLHSVEELGSHRLLHCRLAGEPILVSHPSPLHLKPGDTVGLEFAAADAVLFDAASGSRLPFSLVPCP
nr:ATP-binding cassette domain-containing protein [uncultured Pseudomonas sp.]